MVSNSGWVRCAQDIQRTEKEAIQLRRTRLVRSPPPHAARHLATFVLKLGGFAELESRCR
eukprot:scaffold2286_cov240-Pinguiococcus_pyrenoidosus.AAC.2